ncbi:MAG: GTPase Era [Candidatus Kapaibacterium sp.]|jgi:GTP-binding protein Era
MSRFGYVAIIGKPNAGKSTLLNALLGEQLSIVTSKPETTRRSVVGIFTNETMQAVFLDTPGVVPRPKFELHRQMIGFIHQAVQEADVILVIVDITESMRTLMDVLTEQLRNDIRDSGKPCILVVNKMDVLDDKTIALPKILELMKTGLFKENVAISAKYNKFVEELVRVIDANLPEGEFAYDPEQLSTQPEIFFVAEYVREQCFELFREEIPYSTEVRVTKFEERTKGKYFIQAEVVVDRTAQRAIVIGSKGASLKELGSRARARIEEHLGVGVFLELHVRVKSDWRDSERDLREFGYEGYGDMLGADGPDMD